MKMSFFVILIAALGEPAQAMTALEVAQKMDAVSRGADARGSLTVTIQNSRGTKVRKAKFLRVTVKGEDRTLFDFEEPADVRGTKILSWSQSESASDFWIFLPALRKTRRLSGASRYEKFLNSGFIYEDLAYRKPAKDEFSDSATEKCSPWICLVIEARPKDDLPYSRRKLWIRSDIFLPIKIEYYGEGKLVKTQLNQNIEKINGIWSVQESQMRESDGQNTSFIFSDMKYNSGISESEVGVARLR